MTNRIEKHLEALDTAEPKSQRGQKVTSADFKHVGKGWYEKTHGFDYAYKMIEEGRGHTEDIKADLREMVPTITSDDQVGFAYKDGRVFIPTDYALGQIASRIGLSTTIKSFTAAKTGPNGKVLYERDRGDAEVLLHILQNGMRPDRIDHEKEFLWRANTSDNTLRAMLTDKYVVIDNEWILSVFEKTISEARVSHFKGDSDTFCANLLIPDTIREESDSDYGAMVSVGNSEIGQRRASGVPGLFRHICDNSLILGRKDLNGLIQVHRGTSLDLFDMERRIVEGLQEQIPLIPQGIDKLLNTRKLGWDGDSIRPLIAQTAMKFGLDKRHSTEILRGYQVECKETPINRKTLFGLINSVTRAAQSFELETWERMNTISGEMIDYETREWESLTKSAKSLGIKETEAMFSMN